MILDPIFNFQIRYTLKLTDVVCHKDHVLRSGVRGNQYIQRTDRCSAALKIGANFSVLGSRCSTKGKDAQRNQKAKKCLLIFSGIGAVLHSILQFSQCDGGNADAAVQFLFQSLQYMLRLVLHRVDADVGVQHIRHRLSRSSWTP